MTYNDILKLENIGKRYVTKLGYKVVVVEVVEVGLYIKNLGLQIVISDSEEIQFEEV